MNKITSNQITLSIVGVLMLVIVLCIFAGKVPAQLPLNASLDPKGLASTFAALLAWLFAVALFVERAVEVIVMVFRDQEADLLDHEEENVNEELKSATSKVDALVKTNAPIADMTTANTAVDAARGKLMDVQKRKTVYRAKTKEVALQISFVLGILVSCAGVHALDGILSAEGVGKTSALFKILDIFVTGAVIAGGSEGIHRMANAFTSTMDSISSRADQSQKKPTTN